ncbi:DNA polymerase I [Klebsiella pneumoniae]|nr:DNA polymerase I [Klebsiella pneumoniae]
MRIAPTVGVTSACRSTKPDARRCRRRWWPRCRRCGPLSNSGGIRCWSSPGSEADDLAATLAVKVAQAGHQATIVSTDKGYCQLLSPTIRIRDYFQKRWLDAPFIASEFGVTPEQLADYWGLAGISSSKVPGVAGIGPKSAAQLLNEFQDLEGLYARLAEVPGKWRKKLAAHQEMAFTCREVARLQTDLQLDGNLQQLRLTR